MPAIKYINRLKTIDRLIQLKMTGSPKELAIKLEISERQVFRYIENLQELGGKIEFDKLLNSYVYFAEIELLMTYCQKNKNKLRTDLRWQ
ncbi:MAG: HTH domain-containing protein [Marinilabiliaceae bacterium]|nr:HTH domain-containing protein [Marinilabiliaceae bacterium]